MLFIHKNRLAYHILFREKTMKIITTAALLLGTTLYISAAEPTGRENSAASIQSSNYIPLQKNIPPYQCGSAYKTWKDTLEKTWEGQPSFVRQVIEEKGGLKSITSYTQAKILEDLILARQVQFQQQQLRQREQEQERLRVENLRQQQEQQQRLQEQERQLRRQQEEHERLRVENLLQQQEQQQRLQEKEQELRRQQKEQERLRAKVQKQKIKLLTRGSEKKYKEEKLLPVYMQGHENQLSKYVSPQTNLITTAKTASKCDVHQLHQLNATHEQMIEDAQAQLDMLREHMVRGKADAAIGTLSSYLTMYAPSHLSTTDINHKFLSNIATFQQTLESLEIILNDISNVYEPSAGRSNIKHKILLNGLLENVRLMLNNLLGNYPDNLPDADDYEGVMNCLLAYSKGEAGIAFQKKGQNGAAGLTALESLIGGFAYGTTHEMYTQHPNLFNFLMQCEIEPTTFMELIKLRENLCRFNVMVTPVMQPVLSDARIIQNFTAGKAEFEERANQLLGQLTASTENGLTYQSLTENIELWRTNKIFEIIRQFNTPQDFYNYANSYNQIRNELETSLRIVSQHNENFLSRNSKLSKLVGDLSGTPFTFDHSVAYRFKDALANIVHAELRELSRQELYESFNSYFKNPEILNNFLNILDRISKSKIYLSKEKTTADLILRISDAQTKHQSFINILSTLAEKYNTMPFNDFSEDMGKQKTIYYLYNMVNTYQHNTYIEMSPDDRKDCYRHALDALQDHNLWATDTQEWVNFFKNAYDTYVAARDAIVALNLPQADGEGRLLPGFDFSVEEKKDNSISSLAACVPPPPPPPSVRPLESWPNFIQTLKKYSQGHPHHKDLILDILRSELKDAQLYVDYVPLDIPELKSKLRDQDINI